MSEPAHLSMSGTALVTGSSGGLGEHFADFCARNGMDLVLTARSADKLTANAERLRQRHGCEVTVIPADLTRAEERTRLVDELSERGIVVQTLINNAGFGSHGDFASADPDRMLDEVSLNVAAVTHLSRLLVPPMIAQGEGTIINIASTAAYQPIPSMAVYAATKSFVLSLSQALHSELKPKGVQVIAVCPGPTETEFFANTGEPTAMARRRTPEQVVQSTFRALSRGVPSVIDGPTNTLTARAAKLLPIQLVLPMARLYAKPRRKR